MTHTPDLVVGIAELLDTEGIGVYDPDQPLPLGATAIVIGPVPPEPAAVIGLTPYPVADDDTDQAITGVQARFRADAGTLAVLTLADEVFRVLHARRHYVAGGVSVALSWRNSQAWIGQDTRGRQELTANYYLRTTRSGTHLID
ncbi:minor capsid protein [Streptomyces sp. NPDC060194]|uniref:minor capsid protein n=1 Tax=Streptomyces sp. NPDC060194 TaxID=3347069 RepID=UPI0036618560